MKKWLKRIGTGILYTILSFVVVSIMNKLLFGYHDWLYRSVMMSAPWFVITLLKYILVGTKGWKQWEFTLGIAATVLVATLFITGVCLSMEAYWQCTWYVTFSFTYPTCFIPLQDKN